MTFDRMPSSPRLPAGERGREGTSASASPPATRPASRSTSRGAAGQTRKTRAITGPNKGHDRRVNQRSTPASSTASRPRSVKNIGIQHCPGGLRLRAPQEVPYEKAAEQDVRPSTRLLPHPVRRGRNKEESTASATVTARRTTTASRGRFHGRHKPARPDRSRRSRVKDDLVTAASTSEGVAGRDDDCGFSAVQPRHQAQSTARPTRARRACRRSRRALEGARLASEELGV